MELKDLKVKAIRYPHGQHILGSPAKIIDEGSFYRLDDTYIFDKYRIESVDRDGDEVVIKMTDKTVILEVVQ